MKPNQSSSNFAVEQLKKFGWKEGDGIGKTNQGISNPIKASFKFDNSGLGFNIAEEFTKNWWDNLYNTTAKSIDQQQQQNHHQQQQQQQQQPPTAETTTNSSHDEDDEKSKTPLNRKSYFYSRFQKGSTLVDGRSIETPEIVEEKAARRAKQEVEQELAEKINKPKVSDEELFRVCNGRTAHKGARHGIKMSGKLSRLEEQEKLFLEISKQSEKKKHKDHEHPECHIEQNEDELEETRTKKKKKSKSKRHEEEEEEAKNGCIQNDDQDEQAAHQREHDEEEPSKKKKKKKSKLNKESE